MVAKCNTMTKRDGVSYSLWEQPSESASNRFARLDLKHFPKKAITQSTSKSAYYTNSDHIRYDADIPLSKRIHLQGEYHPIVNGGVITHIWLGEQKPDVDIQAGLMAAVAARRRSAAGLAQVAYQQCAQLPVGGNVSELLNKLN